MNLTGRMASNILFADDEVTIQLYSDALRQLRSTEVSANPNQLNQQGQELDWIKQHAQWLYDNKKASKLGSQVRIMCSIEAMEECIARKSDKFAARQISTTLTEKLLDSP